MTRNLDGPSGVYTHMRWLVCGMLCCVSVLAQARPEPLDAAIGAFHQAHQSGRFEEAAAKRQEARSLLDRMPVDNPRFGTWVQSVVQLFQSSGRNLEARTVAETSLARTARLGDSHPARMMLLNLMTDLWLQDGNLLKAVGYLEQAAAAAEAAPPANLDVRSAVRQVDSPGPVMVKSVAVPGFGVSFNPGYVYQRLADLHQRLGRPEEAAAAREKYRATLKNDDFGLARFYEQQNQLDDAAALYTKHAAEATNYRQKVQALQALSNLYTRQEHYADAVAVLQQAIAATQASGKTEAASMAFGMRLQLANILQQAGQSEQAGQMYRQMLAESTQTEQNLQVLTNLANHLIANQHAAEAETLLKDYLTSHSNLEPWQESQVLFNLSHAAQMSGNENRADEYQRAARQKQALPLEAGANQLIRSDIEQAQSASNRGNLDEALAASLRAIEAASFAPDRDQIVWQGPSIASTLSFKNQNDKAEQLYQRLLAVVESWSADTVQPLLSVSQNYARFLMQQNSRWNEAPAAIERYRNLLISANGADSGRLAEVFQMTIEFERAHGSKSKAIVTAQDLLAFQESRNGSTSDPYLRAVQMLANLYESTGDAGRAVPLLLQSVAITDLVSRPTDAQRCYIRMQAARALARQRRFEEAERLANETIALARSLGLQLANQPAHVLEEIRQMQKRII